MRDRYASEAAIRAKLEPVTGKRWPGSHLELEVTLGGETVTIWVIKGESPLGATLARVKGALISVLLEMNDPDLLMLLEKTPP